MPYTAAVRIEDCHANRPSVRIAPDTDTCTCRGAIWCSLGEKLRMALGMAQGMQALEAVDSPILHRDFKPFNVFIEAAGRPYVADMDLASIRREAWRSRTSVL